MLTLKIQQMTINDHPYQCPECASEAFTLDGVGFIDALPVRGNCWQSHGWEEPLITLGHLKLINEVRTGRERAEDDDTFAIQIGGAVLAGTLHPDVILDDLMRAGDVYWKRIIKPAIRRRKNKAVRAVKRPIKTAKAAVAGATSDTVAAAKAAAIGAAWGWQAGGTTPDPNYTPEPVNPCAACTGGYIQLDTHLHDATRVRCSVCHGTGEID
ncbi:hypothetical protein [Streptomyces chartreusis]|uniref:hypothetical protein n=1 Tax=Streptomyces chartreusis TaxID=1969 RepID=UPI00123D98B2|nr:hypothetical protein [Streptomyces chartreusis]QEV66232.1 hypothetical protein CP983_05845 [Streptomyces chartreusis]GGW98818.1 hypothetical protein GCM10010321_11570 [Streptomyces chartreusis]